VGMKVKVLFGIMVSLLLVTGCRTAYYSTWETFGVHKRDLLKTNVVAARDEQKAAGQEFKSALTRLKELYGFEGGDVEKTYNALKKDFDNAEARAEKVHSRIKDVETVANDLFVEWENELKEISSESLRDSDRNKLRETRRRYDELHTALKQAEKSMDPVLIRFRDQVLYLKHNLNASAIASLKGESMDIQSEISKLLQEMNTAIARADTFINSLP
jgi:Skp family chaperone for outer membrane proteins